MDLITLAQAASPAAPMVPLVTDPTALVIPYGSILSDISGYLAVALAGVVVWGMRLLPGQLYALAMTARVDQLLVRAITFGLNSVVGASEGHALRVDVSNKVLREALAYALEHGGTLLKSFMGSPEDIAEKIWSRLNIAPEVSKPDLPLIAARVASDVAIAAPERARQAEISN